MAGNDGKGNIVERDDWQTPQWLFDLLHEIYNFNIDCCANWDNHKLKGWFNRFEEWDNPHNMTCWMNPPFSKAEEMFKHFFKIVKQGVCIYRCDNMETKVWQDIILKNADWVVIPKGRINYEGKVGKGSRFPSALIGIGVEPFEMENATTLLIRHS